MDPLQPHTGAPSRGHLRRRPVNALVVWLAAVVAPIAVGVLTACYDTLTEPQRGMRPEQARPRFILNPDTIKNSLNAGTWVGRVDPWDGGDTLGTPWLFAFPTIVIVNIAGVIEQGDGAMPGNHYLWGPTGDINTHSGAIGYQLANGGGSYIVWPVRTTDTVVFRDQVRALRAGVLNAQPDQWPRTDKCGIFNSQTPRLACFTYTGQSQLIWTRPHVGLTLTRPDTGQVGVTNTVTFTAAPAVAKIGALDVPMAEVTWRWLPDNDITDDLVETTGPPDVEACPTNVVTCRFMVLSSGTMYVHAYVNGEWQFKARHVDIVGSPLIKACALVPEVADSFPEISTAKMDSAKQDIWRNARISNTEPAGYIVDSAGVFDLNSAGWEFKPCETRPPSGRAPAGTVATIHPHVFESETELTVLCPEVAKREKRRIRAAGDTASRSDWDAAAIRAEVPRHFILTRRHIIMFRFLETMDREFKRLPRCGY